jgi:hypothetical protein
MNSIIKGFDPVILPFSRVPALQHPNHTHSRVEEFPFHSQMGLIPGFSKDGRKNTTDFYTFINNVSPRHMAWIR